MSLSDFKLNASIAVSDMERADAFYEGKLGLPVEQTGDDGSRIYLSGGDSSLHVYESPAHAGESTATLATWYVDNVERVVDELSSKGVTFEHYDELETNEKGISPRAGGGKVAWFKDPDGNTFAVEGPERSGTDAPDLPAESPDQRLRRRWWPPDFDLSSARKRRLVDGTNAPGDAYRLAHRTRAVLEWVLAVPELGVYERRDVVVLVSDGGAFRMLN